MVISAGSHQTLFLAGSIFSLGAPRCTATVQTIKLASCHIAWGIAISVSYHCSVTSRCALALGGEYAYVVIVTACGKITRSVTYRVRK